MSTKTTFKRIALVAVASLGFGVLSSVTPASAAAVTGSVTPVSVTYTGTTLDAAPYARVSWTTTAIMTTADTATVTLTSAPTAAAQIKIVANTSIGATRGSFGAGEDVAGEDSLTATDVGTDIAYGGATVAAAGSASLGIQADVAGYYAGTITTTTATGVPNDTVSFSFTTRGKAVSYTATVSVASVSPSGTSTLTVTLLDSAGNTTQPGLHMLQLLELSLQLHHLHWLMDQRLLLRELLQVPFMTVSQQRYLPPQIQQTQFQLSQ